MYHNLIIPQPTSSRRVPAMGLSPGFKTMEEARDLLREYGWKKVQTPQDMPELYEKDGQLATILSEIDSLAIYE